MFEDRLNALYYKLYELPETDKVKSFFECLDGINHIIHSPDIQFKLLTEELVKLKTVSQQIDDYIEYLKQQEMYRKRKFQLLLLIMIFGFIFIIYYFREYLLLQIHRFPVYVSSIYNQHFKFRLWKKKLSPYYSLLNINKTLNYYISVPDLYSYSFSVLLLDTSGSVYSVLINKNITVLDFKLLISPIYRLESNSILLYNNYTLFSDYDYINTYTLINPLLLYKLYHIDIIYSNGTIYRIPFLSHHYIGELKYIIKRKLHISTLYHSKIVLTSDNKEELYNNRTLQSYTLKNYESLYLYYYYNITIQIRNEYFSLQIETNELVDKLYSLIKKDYNISYPNQQFIYKDVVLFPYLSFAYYNIKPNSNIYYHKVITITVYLKSLTTVTISPTISVLNLKYLLSHIYDIPPIKLVLFKGQEFLFEQYKIAYYHITDGSSLIARVIQ